MGASQLLCKTMEREKLFLEDPLDWIKKNCQIFLDEMISPKVKNVMKQRGYKKVYSIDDVQLRGKNDGWVMNCAKENRYILVTFDKHLHKQTYKYDDGMTIQLDNLKLGKLGLAKNIEQSLLKNCSKIKLFYDS